MARLKSELTGECPCCRAPLVVDTNLKRVVSHVEPERGDKPNLDDAQGILRAETARARRCSRIPCTTSAPAATPCRSASKKRCGRRARNRSHARSATSTGTSLVGPRALSRGGGGPPSRVGGRFLRGGAALWACRLLFAALGAPRRRHAGGVGWRRSRRRCGERGRDRRPAAAIVEDRLCGGGLRIGPGVPPPPPAAGG